MIKQCNVEKIALKVLFSEDCDVKTTYQNPFPKSIPCPKKTCDGNMIPMLQVDDREGNVANFLPEQLVKDRKKDIEALWPHDALVVMVYYCPKCGDVKADYNQG